MGHSVIFFFRKSQSFPDPVECQLHLSVRMLPSSSIVFPLSPCSPLCFCRSCSLPLMDLHSALFHYFPEPHRSESELKESNLNEFSAAVFTYSNFTIEEEVVLDVIFLGPFSDTLMILCWWWQSGRNYEAFLVLKTCLRKDPRPCDFTTLSSFSTLTTRAKGKKSSLKVLLLN